MKTWKWIVLATTAASACGGMEGGAAESNLETDTNEAEYSGGRCAGPNSLECSPGKFCATSKKSKRCPDAETKGVCRSIPEACTQIYDPACGCDGNTYGNACEAARVAVAIAYKGPCAPFCGGFAGFACPGAGTCVENTSDSCDPAEGDFDCGRLCRCEVSGLCDEGMHWDGSPEVCGCLAD